MLFLQNISNWLPGQPGQEAGELHGEPGARDGQERHGGTAGGVWPLQVRED